MTKPKVFVARGIPEAGLDIVRKNTDAEIWSEETPPPYEVLLEKVRGMDGLMCLLTDRIDAELMAAAGPSLKVISQMAVGYDNIDVSAATSHSIPVGNTPGVLTDTTADFAFTLLMAAGRRVVEGDRYVKDRRWKTWGPTLLMGQDIYQATLGLVGFGRIGQAMAQRAFGFDMRVLFYDPSESNLDGKFGARRTTFDAVLAEADFLSLHVPLTPETYHLISESEFKAMKPNCVLVNTARGPVVDPQALYAALKNGELAAAALDVTEPEPISPDDPLLTLDNCLVVPHIASSSVATRGRMATMAAENLLAGLAGKPLPNCVNPEVYGAS